MNTAIQVLLIGLTGAWLVACGPQGAAPAQSQPGVQNVGAALDPCAQGRSTFAASVCRNARLAPLDTQVRNALTAEAANVSDAGAQMMVQSQQRWLETQRVACGILEANATLTAEQTRCMEASLRARAQQAGSSVEEVGGYTFQRVEISGANAITAEAASAAGLAADDAPNAIVRDIRFPRIDNNSTPQAQRFNQLVAQQPQFRLEDQTDEEVRYQIAFAGPELISVRFDVSSTTLGAANSDRSSRAVTVVMTTGQALAASDVFRAGSGWENFVTQRAVDSLTRQFREEGFTPPLRDVQESATRPHLWLITTQGLTILMPPYSFGAPQAFGGAEVSIPWAQLRPYLNPNAPAPIGARA